MYAWRDLNAVPTYRDSESRELQTERRGRAKLANEEIFKRDWMAHVKISKEYLKYRRSFVKTLGTF